LYIRYGKTNDEFREGTLRSYARLLAGIVRAYNGRHLDPLPAVLTSDMQDNDGRYAILSERGDVLAASPGVTHAFVVITGGSRTYFTLKDVRANQTEYGMSTRVKGAVPPRWIQVVFPANHVLFDSVLEEFMQDIGWIWVPFILGMLVINVLIAKIALKPLSNAAEEAELIGPSSVSMRLPEAKMPKDVLALVRAINRALERLENGFHAQEDFVADVTHELRTPLAVIKAQLALIEGAPIAALREDVAGMERLLNQLLDRIRVGGMHIESGDIADLSEIARSTAAFIAPLVIAKGRLIEVVGADRPVPINGSHDYLFRALRNLAENAVDHTPPDTTITIAVSEAPSISVADRGPGVPEENRRKIVQRFWLGRRDRSGHAGLGLSIVEHTLAGHGGALEISDAPGGGAMFVMRFPKNGRIQAEV
jgi:signal transduction histidine kinase